MYVGDGMVDAVDVSNGSVGLSNVNTFVMCGVVYLGSFHAFHWTLAAVNLLLELVRS
jgi:hypothetical protein